MFSESRPSPWGNAGRSQPQGWRGCLAGLRGKGTLRCETRPVHSDEQHPPGPPLRELPFEQKGAAVNNSEHSTEEVLKREAEDRGLQMVRAFRGGGVCVKV